MEIYPHLQAKQAPQVLEGKIKHSTSACDIRSTCLQVIAFFQNIEESLHISMAYVTLLKYAVYILTATHVSACFWFFIACYSENT